METVVATAEQIQREMLEQGKSMLLDAQIAMARKEDDRQHAQGLSELGFTLAAKAVETKSAEAKELDNYRQMYAFEYPSLKFIPTNTMTEVCRKHNLTIGGVNRYTGEVPEWALKQIARNKHHFTYHDEFDQDHYMNVVRDEYDRKRQEAEASGFTGTVQVSFGDLVRLIRLTPNGKKGFRGPAMSWYASYKSGEMVNHGGGTGGNMETYIPREKGNVKTSNLMIAAPAHQMRMGPNEFRTTDGTIEEVKPAVMVFDPIVCLEVKGGYIVLAAWGEEGQDPRVFNSANN